MGRKIGFAGLWLGSLAVAGLVGRLTAPDPVGCGPGQLAAAPAGSAGGGGSRGDGGERAGENGLPRTRQAEVPPAQPDSPSAATAGDGVWRKAGIHLDRTAVAREGGEFLGALDEIIDLTIAVAGAGPEGVAFLAHVASTSESDQERQTAVELLAHLPGRASLEFMMDGRAAAALGRTADLPAGRPWEWEHVVRQVEELSTTELGDRLPELVASFELASAEDLDEPALRGLAQVALRHGDPGARDHLANLWPRLNKNQQLPFLDYLVFVESDASLRFLDQVRTTGADPEVLGSADRARADLGAYLEEVKRAQGVRVETPPRN